MEHGARRVRPLTDRVTSCLWGLDIVASSTRPNIAANSWRHASYFRLVAEPNKTPLPKSIRARL